MLNASLLGPWLVFGDNCCNNVPIRSTYLLVIIKRAREPTPLLLASLEGGRLQTSVMITASADLVDRTP